MNVSDQDCELNLAPIIDCFTVLITFMLVSASFLAVGIFETTVRTEGLASANAKPPAVTLEVELTDQNTFHLKITGKEHLDKTIPAENNDWNLAALKVEVEKVKKKWPDTTSLVLSANNDVQYLQIIRTMEALKQTPIPAVLLGGF
jgi:biopolymer transport protein ExbD